MIKHRRIALNIRAHSFERIAEHILRTAQAWRCDKLMAHVGEDGSIEFADIGVNVRAAQDPSLDIIGVFGRDSLPEDVEDAVIAQKRQMTAQLQVAA